MPTFPIDSTAAPLTAAGITEKAIALLMTRADDIGTALVRMEDRLALVLAEREDGANSAEAPAACYDTELLAKIDAVDDRLCALLRHLKALSDRVTL